MRIVPGRRRRPAQDVVTIEVKTSTLYVVATPIGNLEDITLRAIRILKEVDLIASEDTRHTRKLLSHFDIHTPLESYNKDQEAARAEKLITRLEAGENIALVSDAGTPSISDPGNLLVRKARSLGINIVPVPGPSALTAALSISNIDIRGFLFAGFLPARSNQRVKLLKTLADYPYPLIFFESPRRIIPCLRDCLETLGDRNLFLARELTKAHEETITGLISGVLASLGEKDAIKGEFTAIIQGESARKKNPEDADLKELLVWYRDLSGLSMRDAVQRISREFNMSRSQVYKAALEIWKK